MSTRPSLTGTTLRTYERLPPHVTKALSRPHHGCAEGPAARRPPPSQTHAPSLSVFLLCCFVRLLFGSPTVEPHLLTFQNVKNNSTIDDPVDHIFVSKNQFAKKKKHFVSKQITLVFCIPQISSCTKKISECAPLAVQWHPKTHSCLGILLLGNLLQHFTSSDELGLSPIDLDSCMLPQLRPQTSTTRAGGHQTFVSSRNANNFSPGRKSLETACNARCCQGRTAKA